MQLDLPFLQRQQTAEPAQPPSPAEERVEFVRMRRARRYILRVKPDGTLRVTIPRGGSKREAVNFVERHHSWIARQRLRIPPPALSAVDRVVWRQKAEAELPVRLLKLSRQHELPVTQVSIRNQRTRWGSCGRNGHITLNWRLIQMPSRVRDYVIFHELMHVRHPNHSRRFWRAVAQVCDWWRDAERWLRTHGRSLF